MSQLTPFFWSIAACPPGSYGDNCSTNCPNQYYGEYCGLKCYCGPDEKCHTLLGCISITTGKEGSNDAYLWLNNETIWNVKLFLENW